AANTPSVIQQACGHEFVSFLKLGNSRGDGHVHFFSSTTYAKAGRTINLNAQLGVANKRGMQVLRTRGEYLHKHQRNPTMAQRSHERELNEHVTAALNEQTRLLQLLAATRNDRVYFPLQIATFWMFIGLTAYVNYERARQKRRKEAGLCLRCGYDLRASADRCPECGMETVAAATHT
ncbi:MAG TPA: hypothetical protein VFC78_12770, partial [Tepidisphaeraceae bacterium]|nr:hypothetical protein [Tepidisphaeraceae bacterium]